MIWTPLALTLLAVAAPKQDPKAGVVRGEVRSERTGEPVPFALVEVTGSLVPLAVSADSLGNYLLRGVPSGRRLLRAGGFGHGSLEVEVLVPAGREVRIDFTLGLEPVPLSGITVQGSPGARGGEGGGVGEPELGRAVVRALEATPGMAELGLIELGRAARPSQEPVDPTDVLYVRGAPADLKLVLLNGAPVYAPFHAGGLMQAFEPELVRRADLYLGGAPARYDGGLSYVLDLETRSGDRAGIHASGMADLLAAQTVLEGPVGGRAGFLLSGRVVHGLGADWILRDPFPYDYGDALGHLDLTVGTRGTLALTGFWNREALHLAESPATGPEAAVWGNRAASLRYRGPLLGRDAELTLATGAYRAQLPLGSDDWRAVVDGTARQTRLAVELRGERESLNIQYGFSYERTIFEQRARTALAVAEPDEAGSGEGGAGGGEGGATLFDVASSGETGGIYSDLDWGLAPRLRLRGGLRADLFSTDMSVRLAPRLAVIWVLSERAVLTVAGGHYRQFVRESAVVVEDSAGYGGIRAPRSLRLAEASHLLLGLDQLLADELRFGIEGYYKRFDGIPAEAGVGDANASGVDLWLRRGEGRITGWLGYSLGWVWTTPAKTVASGPATGLFSGRQLLSLGVAGEVGSGGRLGLRVGYGSGIPYSALPNSTERGVQAYGLRSDLSSAREVAVDAPPVASAPDEPYLRLDAEVSYPWHTRWGGARLTITPYLKVYNALDRRDAFFYRADNAVPGKPRPLAALPVLPVIGVQWRF
jgi:hypothetical protein